MEDLVEELIGDIKDEYDVDEGETTRLRGGAVEVDGLLNLDDFEDETGIELPEGPYETVAGYLMARLGRLVEKGDTVEVAGHRMVVQDVENRRVGRVRVTGLPAVDGAGDSGGDAAGSDAADGTAVPLPSTAAKQPVVSDDKAS
jgi:putative hemolysin